MRLLFYIFISVPLLVGGLIYTSCRSTDFIINRFIKRVLGESDLCAINESISEFFSFSPEHIDSLPSALWVFSTSLFSSRLFPKRKWLRYVLIFSPLLYSFLLEMVQLLGLTDGTYDFGDIVYSLLGWGSALMVARLFDYKPHGFQLKTYSIVFWYGVLILSNAC